MAQQGYGLSDAVGGFFGTYFKAKEMRMKEDQFNRNMAEEQRQFSLLQAVRESELLRQRQSNFITPKEGDIYTKYGLPAGQEIPIQLADNLLTLANPKNIESEFTLSPGQKRYKDGKVIAEVPAKPDRPSEISQLNQQLKLEKIEEGRTQKQELYNSLMDSWDEGMKAFVVTDSKGNEIMFKDDKAIERYAKEQVIKTKLPGKVNFWSRKGQKVDIKGKHKLAYNTLISKGYSEQEAIDLIKKNEGIK